MTGTSPVPTEPGSILGSLFGVASPEEFLAHHWPDVPLCHAGAAERLAPLTGAPELRSIPAFLQAHPGVAWLNLRLADGTFHHEASVSSETAVVLFRSGMMMDLRDVHSWFQPARRWLEQMVRELKLEFSSHASYCHAFACPKGSGVPKHFDNREVIVVQLHGVKRWRIAPNRVLPQPMMPHVVGGPVHPLNRALAPEGLEDREMPPESETHHLARGSVLFLPRGYWHETCAVEDSLSLSFGFRVPTWAEMFVNTALKELTKEPRWRAPAFDSGAIRPEGTEPFLRALRRALDELLKSPPPPPFDR